MAVCSRGHHKRAIASIVHAQKDQYYWVFARKGGPRTETANAHPGVTMMTPARKEILISCCTRKINVVSKPPSEAEKQSFSPWRTWWPTACFWRTFLVAFTNAISGSDLPYPVASVPLEASKCKLYYSRECHWDCCGRQGSKQLSYATTNASNGLSGSKQTFLGDR